jgi:hypothetical protein
MREPSEAATWPTALEADRRVAIAPNHARRVRHLTGYAVVVLLAAVCMTINKPSRGDEEALAFYLALAAMILAVLRGLRTLHQLATGRPALTIDEEGVELGKKTLQWSQIREIPCVRSHRFSTA